MMFSWEPQLIALLENDKYDEALALLKELQNRATDDSENRHLLLHEAGCLVDLGDLKQALRLYKKLEKKEDIDVDDRCTILLGEAKCLEELGEFREAKRCLKEIRQIDSDGESILFAEFVEINIQFAEGKLTEAIDHATSFLSLHAEELSQPEYERNTYALELSVACERVTAGEFRRAVDSIQTFLLKAREEDHALLRLFLGLAYEGLGEADKAIDAFKEVLRLNSTEDLVSRAHFQLGEQYLKNGAAAWAKQHLLQAENLKSALNVPVKNLYLLLADACGRLGENQEKERYTRLVKQS